MLEKIVSKNCENTFFIKKNKYCDQKMGGKKARKFFFQKHTISLAKNDGKNRLEKLRKHVFFKHTNIVTKNRGKKTREKNFQKTHE